MMMRHQEDSSMQKIEMIINKNQGLQERRLASGESACYPEMSYINTGEQNDLLDKARQQLAGVAASITRSATKNTKGELDLDDLNLSSIRPSVQLGEHEYSRASVEAGEDRSHQAGGKTPNESRTEETQIIHGKAKRSYNIANGRLNQSKWGSGTASAQNETQQRFLQFLENKKRG